MIELSLNDINAQSPYEVSYAPNGDFVFATSLGIHYLISFTDEEPVGGCTTFQFVIQKIEHSRSPHDAKVEQAILAILNVFFAEHLDVLLYMCDDSDGREANRNRLFLAWFKKHATPERFTIRTASAIVEGKGFYAAIIVENRNPLLKTIIEDFEMTAQALTSGKP
jgi:hypothetical protein